MKYEKPMTPAGPADDARHHPVVYRTAHHDLFAWNGRCLHVSDRDGAPCEDHHAVDEAVSLHHERRRDGSFSYLRVQVPGGHIHVGPLTSIRHAGPDDLRRLLGATQLPEAGISLRRWARLGPGAPAAA